jgi:anti-sigma-K factor RskA
VIADPDARTVALQAGEGRLVVGSDGSAVLVLDALDPAPAGMTYEAWIIDGDEATAAGLFPGRDGRDLVPVDGKVEPGNVIAVTVEEAGGVEASENDPIVTSSPI